MGWFTFKYLGNATTPQTDDSELATVVETGDSSIQLPYDIAVTDFVLTSGMVNDHQYAIWVNGKKTTSDLFAAQINPANNTRFNAAAQKMLIPAGSKIQVKTAQLAGAAAEAGKVSFVYLRINAKAS